MRPIFKEKRTFYAFSQQKSRLSRRPFPIELLRGLEATIDRGAQDDVPVELPVITDLARQVQREGARQADH